MIPKDKMTANDCKIMPLYFDL